MEELNLIKYLDKIAVIPVLAAALYFFYKEMLRRDKRHDEHTKSNYEEFTAERENWNKRESKYLETIKSLIENKDNGSKELIASIKMLLGKLDEKNYQINDLIRLITKHISERKG